MGLIRWTLVATTLLLPLPTMAQPALSPSAEPRLGPALAQRLHTGPMGKQPLRLVTIYSDRLEESGRSCVGRVCVEDVPQDQLVALLERPGLLMADLPRKMFPRLDQAGPLIGLPAARARFGATGQGVLIAVIDTGVDWTHPDFIDPEGQTRIAWLLDQGVPSAGLHPELEAIGQGAVFAGSDLQAALDGQPNPVRGAGLDPIGHGTHVAGIAAGDDPVYTGVAPEARLIVVKSLGPNLEGFGEDQVLAGLAFARAVSILEGRPLVINLSLGSQMGAHDGTEPVEIAIEDLVASPFPVCSVAVAAGNEGALDVHARSAAHGGGPPARFEILLPQGDAPAIDRSARVVIDFWHSGSLRARVLTPGGTSSGEVGPGTSALIEDSWTEDGRLILSSQAGAHPLNGLYRTTVTLAGESGMPLSVGTWTVELAGEARRIDAWIGETELAGGPKPRFLNHVDPGELVGPPATARHAISVGVITSRASWPGADGLNHELKEGITVGELSTFSSRGPTRDGRLKPEVVAPGQVVASTLSADADPRLPISIFYSGGSLRMVMPDGRHAVSSGTSMASPFAAGLCALALELNPAMSGLELHGKIASAARSDPATGRILYEPGWGFGKLDAHNLLQIVNGYAVGDPDPESGSCGVSKPWLPVDPDQVALVSAVPRSQEGIPLGPGLAVGISSPTGRFAGPPIDQGNGIYTRALTGHGLRGDAIALDCSLDEDVFGARPQVVLAASHEEAHGAGVTGGAGACSHSDRARLPIPLLLGLATFVLLNRRRAHWGA